MKIINEDKNKTFFLSQNKPENFASVNLFSTNLVNQIKTGGITISISMSIGLPVLF